MRKAVVPLLSIGLLAAQTTSEFKVVSDVQLVVLDVSVKDSAGRFVSGLDRDRFRIFDEGREQPIRVFSGEDTPVTVGIVIDHSGSMRSKRAQVANAVMALIGSSHPEDQVFIVSFGDRVTFDLPSGVDFTGRRDLLRAALDMQPAQGRTALFDAVSAALSHLSKGTFDRKALVLISDGGDTASRTTEEEALRMAKVAGATVHAVGIFDENETGRDLGFLNRIGTSTGGEVVIEKASTDFIAACRTIARDIRSRYTIAFQPPVVTGGPRERKLRVEIFAPGFGKLTARTRKSYVTPERRPQ
jgi:Ca-activated chloride channel family protein